MVKKTEFLAYNTPIKADGIIAIKIRDDDELVAVRRTDGRRRHPHGLARRARPSRFNEERRAPMGRDTTGVRGMNVSEQGQRGPRDGRRPRRHGAARRHRERLRQAHRVAEYPVKGRGTKGVMTIKLTEKKGGLAGALIVREHQDLCSSPRTGWSSAPRPAASRRWAARPRA